MKAIKTDLQITAVRARSRNDGISFTAHTPELTDEAKLVFFALQGLGVQAVISPEEETETVEVKSELEQKSQSSRVRGIIAVYCKKVGRPEKSHDVYYREMEQLFDKYKLKLEEME